MRMATLAQTDVVDWATAQAQELAAPILAKLQATVGLFLADKAFLMDAQTTAATPELQGQAASLYQEQLGLETQLGTVMPPIQAGTYDLGTVSAASALYAAISLHRDAVERLRRAMGVSTSSVGLSWPTMLMYGGIAIAGLGLVTGKPIPIVAGVALGGYGWWTR